MNSEMKIERVKGGLASRLGLVALTATYLTVPWEGNEANWDSLGKVWTVFAGETKGMKKSDYHSDVRRLLMLQTRLENDFHKPLQQCIVTFDAAPISVRAYLLDSAYRVWLLKP
jgi:lysozyme